MFLLDALPLSGMWGMQMFLPKPDAPLELREPVCSGIFPDRLPAFRA